MDKYIYVSCIGMTEHNTGGIAMIEATSCGGVVIFRGKILLLYKNYRNRYEGWVLPKGTVEPGEEYKDTAIREVKEETGLEVTRTEFLFSLPNTYLYSGFLVHTVDCFFRCTVADSSLAHAMDDAAELLWIPVKELRPEDFGLASVRKGIEKLLVQWP